MRLRLRMRLCVRACVRASECVRDTCSTTTWPACLLAFPLLRLPLAVTWSSRQPSFSQVPLKRALSRAVQRELWPDGAPRSSRRRTALDLASRASRASRASNTREQSQLNRIPL
ncbi:hypothetical protein EDB80DRAFT_707369 [Ilyonectria destructans]|nr:hypothetical protein EDB80DRAFT_707369 [Ilyonectria destructans]